MLQIVLLDTKPILRFHETALGQILRSERSTNRRMENQARASQARLSSRLPLEQLRIANRRFPEDTTADLAAGNCVHWLHSGFLAYSLKEHRSPWPTRPNVRRSSPS